MAQLAYPRRGSLGDVAQHGVGPDRRVAGLDLGVGCLASPYDALARHARPTAGMP